MTMMKSSNVEWLGDIPADWNIAQIGNYYELRNKKVSDYDFMPLSVTMKGIVPQLASAAKSDDHSNRKLVRKGDFVINSRSDRRGSCGISPLDGSVSLINTVMEPRGEMNPQYYNWLFHTEQFADEFYKWGHGIVDDLWTTHWQEMKKILIVAPSLDEQQAIAKYLDNTCSKIDAIIAEEKASVDEYKDMKQSVIFEAVTNGLNKNVAMKDSGVPEIGIIPEHWGVKKVKYIGDFFFKGKGISKECVREDGNIHCIRYGEIYSKYNGVIKRCKTLTNLELISLPTYISKGDILFAGTGELVEEIGKNVVYMGDDPCLVGGDIIVLRHSQNPVFFNYTLNSYGSQAQKSKGKAKLKVVHISSSDIGNLKIAIPPMEEQCEIASYLEDRCKTMDGIIEDKKALISDLEAYKKSLIYEVVTGKRRVV